MGVIALQLSGTLLDIEHKAGSFTNQTGELVSYDFEVLHVLEGREVHKVRLPKEVRASDLSYGKGEVIDIEVGVPSNTKIVLQS